MGIGDWTLLALLALWAWLAIRATRRGKTGCCPGTCAACPHRCRGAEKENK